MLWTTMVMPLTALSLSHTQTGMFGYSRLRWHAGRRQSGQVG